MKARKLYLALFALVAVYAGALGYSYMQGYWPRQEPEEYVFGFIEPVPFSRGIRNDSMGLGHFGASRGGGTRLHNGVDVCAPIGTPVKAAEGGRVETADHPRGYGLLVRIYHENDYNTVYAHLSKILVDDGEFVLRGKVIGKTGRTGNADYDDMIPHLHFEIRKDSVPVDPADYFPILLDAAVN